MEQLVILLIIGLISLINWILNKSAQHKARREEEAQSPADETARPVQRTQPDHQSEAEVQARKFLEALGLPMESEPPARTVDLQPAPERTPPPLPVGKKSPPRNFLHKIERDLEQRLGPAPAAPAAHAPSPARRRSIALQSGGGPKLSDHGLAELLESKDGLRRAILVKEILGPPKGAVFDF